jgi:hypothetical protein
MKTPITFLTILVAASPLLAVSSTNNPVFPNTDPALANRLQVTVVMPASFNSIRSDDVAGTLASLVETGFKKDGFRGQLSIVAPGDQAKPDVPTLEIEVIDWRMTPTKFIDCTFNVFLKTNQDAQTLGFFTGSAPAMFGMKSPFERAEAFKAAANDAIDHLYGELRDKNLLSADAL